MNYLKILCVTGLFCSTLKAQLPTFQWAVRGGSTQFENAYAHAVDSAGNVIVVGAFEGTVDFDPGPGVQNRSSLNWYSSFILKLSSSGSFMWVQILQSKGVNGDIQAKKIIEDSNKDLIIAGRFTDTVDFNPGSGVYTKISSGANDAFILKLDKNGSFIWAGTVGGKWGDELSGLEVDSWNDIFIAGTITGTVDLDPSPNVATHYGIPWDKDMYVLKLTSGGAYLWSRTFGSPGAELVFDICLDQSDDVYLSGQFMDSIDFDPGSGVNFLKAANGSLVLLKLTGNTGNFSWAKNFAQNSWGHHLEADQAGHIYIGGEFYGTVDFDPGPGLDTASVNKSGAFICKYTQQGQYLLKATFTSTINLRMNDLKVDNWGDLYVCTVFQGQVDFEPGPATNIFSNAYYTPAIAKYKNLNLVDVVFLNTYSLAAGAFNYSAKLTINNNTGDIYTTGYFRDTVDFDHGTATYTLVSAGETDFYVHKMTPFKGFNAVAIPEVDGVNSPNSVYPIPTKGMLFLKGYETGSIVTVIDPLGRKVLESKIDEPTFKIDVSELPAGVYFVSIKSGNTETCHKVIKE